MEASPCAKLVETPWLIPFIQAIRSGVPAKPSELSLHLGVRTSLARIALWKLKKAGLLKGDKVPPEAVECLKELRTLGKRFVWRWGSNYFLVVTKRTRVAVHTIPANVVERVNSSRSGPTSVRELAQQLKLPPILVSRALRVLEVLDRT
mgnify:CR=1 FL=1